MKKQVGDPTLATFHEAPGNFEKAVSAAELLTGDEKIALMKWISMSLKGPRFFTMSEVQQITKFAIEEFAQKHGMKISFLGGKGD